jgi:hypothetical protein
MSDEVHGKITKILSRNFDNNLTIALFEHEVEGQKEVSVIGIRTEDDLNQVNFMASGTWKTQPAFKGVERKSFYPTDFKITDSYNPPKI